MPNIHEILKQYWGHDSFRFLQDDIIRSVLDGHDTLALMPTGGGKSVCFQVPGLANEGLCLVISPLIALMKDQVGNLEAKGIKATTVFSGMSRREIDITLDNCAYGNYKFLYISPERLSTDILRERLPKMNVNLIAVDEAHCISQWGYDFRPSYLAIAEIKEILPNVPILALTATATKKVVVDIQEKLLFKEPQVFIKSFFRENLAYVVLEEESKINKLVDILEKVPGSAVVYTRSRGKCKEIANYLLGKKISADHYHAGLAVDERSAKQESWIQGKTRVIVCTNAFGMGIDKADVRTVVHLDLPDSLEAYFQEAGRAGRDGKKAYAVLLYNKADILRLQENLKLSFPKEEFIQRVYHALGDHYQLAHGSGEGESFDFDMEVFCEAYQLERMAAFNSLKLLEQFGWISLSDAAYIPPRLMVVVNKEELYNFQLKNEKLEPLIKLILRNHGGAFDQYVRLNIAQLAMKLDEDKKQIISELQHIHQMGIIKYEGSKDKPQLTFIHARPNRLDTVVDKIYYEQRKKTYKEKINAVIQYVSNRDTCRSVQLLAYFDEKKKQKCGVCDVCQDRHRTALLPKEYEQVEEQVNQLLHQNDMEMSELVPQIKGVREELTIKAIRWMLDNSILNIKDDKLTLV